MLGSPPYFWEAGTVARGLAAYASRADGPLTAVHLKVSS